MAMALGSAMPSWYTAAAFVAGIACGVALQQALAPAATAATAAAHEDNDRHVHTDQDLDDGELKLVLGVRTDLQMQKGKVGSRRHGRREGFRPGSRRKRARGAAGGSAMCPCGGGCVQVRSRASARGVLASVPERQRESCSAGLCPTTRCAWQVLIAWEESGQPKVRGTQSRCPTPAAPPRTSSRCAPPASFLQITLKVPDEEEMCVSGCRAAVLGLGLAPRRPPMFPAGRC
jgi:hypothetical protein